MDWLMEVVAGAAILLGLLTAYWFFLKSIYPAKDRADEIHTVDTDDLWKIMTDPIRIVHLLEHTTGWDDFHLPEYAHNDPTPVSLKEGLDFHPHSRTCRRGRPRLPRGSAPLRQHRPLRGHSPDARDHPRLRPRRG